MKMSSERRHSETVLDLQKAKKRLRGRRKNPISLTCNETDLPLVNYSPLIHESIQHPMFSTCSTEDTKLLQHEAVPNLPGVSYKYIHHDSVESSDKNIRGKIYANSISEVGEHDEQGYVNYVPDEMGLVAGQANKKRRKRRQEKDPNALTSNDMHYDSLKHIPLLHNFSLMTDSIQQPMDITHLVADSEIMQHDAELGPSVELCKGSHQNIFGSTIKNDGLVDKRDINDGKRSPEVSAGSISEVREHNLQESTSINNSQGVGLGARQAKRKRRKGKWKNPKSITIDGDDCGDPKCLTNINNSLVDNNPSQQPIISGFSMAESELIHCNAERTLSEDVNMGVHHNFVGSNENYNGGWDMQTANDTKNKVEVLNSISEHAKHDDQLCNNNVCKKMSFGAPRRKKMRRKKNRNAQRSDDIHCNDLKCNSSRHNSSLENDSFLQPIVTASTCSMADSESMLHDSELGFPKETIMGMHQNAFESNGKYSGGRDITTRCTFEFNTNSFSPDAEYGVKRCTGSASQETGFGVTKTKKKRKRKRKRKSVTNNLDLESKVIASSSVDAVENRTQATSLNGLGEAVASGGMKNTLKGESKAGHITTLNVEEQLLIEMPLVEHYDIKNGRENSKNRGKINNLNYVKDSLLVNMYVPDLSGVDFEKQVNEAKLNTNLKMLDIHSADNIYEESTRFSKEQITSEDPSDRDPLNEFMDQNGRCKIKGSSFLLSRLDAFKDNLTHSANTEMPHASIERSLSGCFKRKLLVLDLNGILADIVPRRTGTYKPDGILGMKAVFKRPFCEDFLQFCFDRFTVGVWSSRTEKNVRRVINLIMKESKSKLAFCWNQSHCTKTGFNTLENSKKPLVLKELVKLWEKKFDCDLPWKMGDYNESNTLLLDDSPYKALRNPPNTAIFPNSYQYKDDKDNSLAGPGGDLRVYLDGLASAEDVQKYVEQNPYGQQPITISNSSWSFYAKVLGTKSCNHENHVHPLGLEHSSLEYNASVSGEELKQTSNSR